MAIVKMVANTYLDSESVLRLLRYIADDEKTSGNYGGVMCTSSVEEAYMEMCRVKDFFYNTEKRQLAHFIISSERFSNLPLGLLCQLARMICLYLAADFQVFFGVHCCGESEHNRHIHIVCNSVSFVNGKKFHFDYSDLATFKMFVASVIGETTELNICQSGGDTV